jgi:hypothetical protein
LGLKKPKTGVIRNKKEGVLCDEDALCEEDEEVLPMLT